MICNYTYSPLFEKIKTNIISKIFSPFLILVLLLYQRSFRLYWLIFSLWVRVEQERSAIFSGIFLCENLCQIISIKRLCFVGYLLSLWTKINIKTIIRSFKYPITNLMCEKINWWSYIILRRNRSLVLTKQSAKCMWIYLTT